MSLAHRLVCACVFRMHVCERLNCKKKKKEHGIKFEATFAHKRIQVRAGECKVNPQIFGGTSA